MATAEFSKFAYIECGTFTPSSFRIWNSSTGIVSPSLAWAVAGSSMSSSWPDLHARHSVERHGRWGRLVGRPASRTSTLSTLLPCRGGGGAQRVFQPPGLARSAICRVAWAVAGPGGSTSWLCGTQRLAWAVVSTGGLSSRLDLHARHSVERPGQWRGPAGRPAGHSALGARPWQWRGPGRSSSRAD